MNLHILDTHPAAIPHLLDDKRIGKMLMETNQMLSLAVKVHGGSDEAGSFPVDEFHIGPGMVCDGMAHVNHPVSIWVRQTYSNFLFAAQYAKALAYEFKFRFDKDHASAARTDFIVRNYQDNIPGGPLTPFQNSARHEGRGIDFTHLPVVTAYRRYMLARWETDVHPPKWTGREDPRPMLKELVLEDAA